MNAVIGRYVLILGIQPEPTRVPFKSTGDASLAFISGESGNSNIPKSTPIRPPDHGSRQPTPHRNPGFSQTQSLSYPNQNPTSLNTGSTSGRRDFVNLNHKPMQHGHSSSHLTSQHSSGNHEIPKNSSSLPVQGSPESGKRDFVNPNYKPGQQTHSKDYTTPRHASTTPKSTSFSAPSGGRDFVNPNYKPNSSPSSTPVSLQSILGPKDPFPTLKPNPSIPKMKPQDPFPALRPKDPFPALPGSPQNPVVPGPAISYAGKASGGVTTNRPGVIPNPSIGGRIGLGDPTTSNLKPAEGETGKAYEDGPKDNELREFSEQLLKKDVNNAFKFVKLNVQGKTTSGSKTDEAPQK